MISTDGGEIITLCNGWDKLKVEGTKGNKKEILRLTVGVVLFRTSCLDIQQLLCHLISSF